MGVKENIKPGDEGTVPRVTAAAVVTDVDDLVDGGESGWTREGAPEAVPVPDVGAAKVTLPPLPPSPPLPPVRRRLKGSWPGLWYFQKTSSLILHSSVWRRRMSRCKLRTSALFCC